MGSRRILIGLIALVGVSLPIGPDGECGFTAIRDWAIGQLADWDPYTPSRGNPRIVAEPTLVLERGQSVGRDGDLGLGLV